MSLNIYFKLISVSIRSQMQHRASFCMLTLAHFFATGAEAMGLALLFARFKSIQGWNLSEMLLLYGVVQMAFALSELIGRGFDTFSNLVQRGEFDRFLLRPRSPLLQVLGSECQLMRLGRFLQGLVAFGYALITLTASFSWASYFFLLMIFLSTSSVFLGLLILRASLSFWTIENIEVFNVATHGGAEAFSYPLSVYKPWMRGFFTYLIPLGFSVYFPILTLLEKSDQVFEPSTLLQGLIFGLSGFLFLIFNILIFCLGVKKYQSTGS